MSQQTKGRERLPANVLLAKRMRVMVTNDLETDWGDRGYDRNMNATIVRLSFKSCNRHHVCYEILSMGSKYVMVEMHEEMHEAVVAEEASLKSEFSTYNTR